MSTSSKIKRIAVVCARLPTRNTGMVTVDLAAYTSLRRLFPEAEITQYAFKFKESSAYTPTELPFKYLDLISNSEQFLSSDVIIYWGDFVHSRSYWIYDMDRWEGLDNLTVAERARHQQRIQDYRERLIFLTGQTKEWLRRVVVFGSTIITNEAEDNQDAIYTSAFDRFYRNIGGVLFRDALSATKVSPFRGQEATLGCDCAFLLTAEDLAQLPGYVPAVERRHVGVFFGRTSAKIRMLLFSRLIGKALGERLMWLPWLSSGTKMRHVGNFLGFKIHRDAQTPGQLLSQLSGCRFVVTDTYHLCVNAWRMGIPAICIGKGADGQLHSLADKKKEILFEMYGARQFYVFVESINNWFTLQAEAKRAAEVLRNTQLCSGVSANISAHQIMARKRLETALRRAYDESA